MWVSGAVQGCGFRPHVFELAVRHSLSGFVRNEGDGVRIVVEGREEALQRFRAELTSGAFSPRIASVRTENSPARHTRGFAIEPSAEPDHGATFAPADVAACPDCLAELREPSDRRHRYPFVSCARCGPRWTALTGLPYDRGRTTMAAFPLCPACRREYDGPADRRFHAQTLACPACGPALALLGPDGAAVRDADPLAAAVAALRGGRIVAVKGLGGFHLACDARRAGAVAELRRRKHRDEKPLAVMVADLAAASGLCEVTAAEEALLASPARPIVLLRKQPGNSLADGVAPGNAFLGVMLPYTPLHHLLLAEAGGPLVMTSGNRSDEPITFDDADALRRLAGIADLFLVHDRPIRRRCDDSVARVVAGSELPVRRSRGYVPHPLPLPVPCPRPTLATGGHLKAVFALGREAHAVLSHHLGDLDGYEAARAYTDAVADYEVMLRFRPSVVAHDAHPDYATTRYARGRAAAGEPELVAVQHHHAHMAACMAENGLNELVIGVTFDGSGYGTDGTVWGGEFLVGDYRDFRRAAHLRPVPLPGGDVAAREPWRMAVSHLLEAGEKVDSLAGRIDAVALRTVATMATRRLNSPPTSSAGRLFDAVAALAGLRDRAGYEGQAAVELEGLAAETGPCGGYEFAIDAGETIQLDTRPLIRAVLADVRGRIPPAVIARRFHSALVEMIATVCRMVRERTGLNAVVCSGGVFLNAILLAESLDRLRRDQFRVYRHTLVPPGDGGLCLGQLVVAAARESCDNPPGSVP